MKYSLCPSELLPNSLYPVSGARIDQAHHDNWAKRALEETVSMDDAVGVAKRMTGDDTLIVVTADHSHVMTIEGYPKRGNDILGK